MYQNNGINWCYVIELRIGDQWVAVSGKWQLKDW